MMQLSPGYMSKLILRSCLLDFFLMLNIQARHTGQGSRSSQCPWPSRHEEWQCRQQLVCCSLQGAGGSGPVSGEDRVTRTRSVSDGSGSPLSYNKSSLQFRSGPAQDLLYEQHAQLLRDSRHALHSCSCSSAMYSRAWLWKQFGHGLVAAIIPPAIASTVLVLIESSDAQLKSSSCNVPPDLEAAPLCSWGSREESQRQQMQQGAADMDYSTFSQPRGRMQR